MVQESKVANSIQTPKVDIVVCIPNDLHYKRAERRQNCMTHEKKKGYILLCKVHGACCRCFNSMDSSGHCVSKHINRLNRALSMKSSLARRTLEFVLEVGCKLLHLLLSPLKLWERIGIYSRVCAS